VDILEIAGSKGRAGSEFQLYILKLVDSAVEIAAAVCAGVNSCASQ